MDGSFRTFDHTGDLGLEIEAGDPARLFECAAEALMAQIADVTDERGDLREASLAVDAAGPETLLVDWLNAVLLESELARAVWTRATVHEWSPRAVRATLSGPPRDARRMTFLREVKAVSHHALELVLEPSACRARLILDI
jgi:SHS2 domain-containing protein